MHTVSSKNESNAQLQKNFTKHTHMHCKHAQTDLPLIIENIGKPEKVKTVLRFCLSRTV